MCLIGIRFLEERFLERENDFDSLLNLAFSTSNSPLNPKNIDGSESESHNRLARILFSPVAIFIGRGSTVWKIPIEHTQ